MASTSISLPERLLVSNGVNTIAPIVEIAVMLTESTKFERERKTITFEAVPPGQQDNNINPTAKKGGNSNRIPNNHPKKDIKVNCNKKPVRIHEDVLVTCLKSLSSRVSLTPNIIPPKPKVIRLPENQVKTGG